MTDRDTFSTEDVSEMRRQGDLRAFIRQQYRPTTQTAPTPSVLGDRPGHICGAWPTGSVGSAAPMTAGVVCSCPSCTQLQHNPRPEATGSTA